MWPILETPNLKAISAWRNNGVSSSCLMKSIDSFQGGPYMTACMKNQVRANLRKIDMKTNIAQHFFDCWISIQALCS